ncbi:hypothetical protein RN001_009582 [Aquatica leii]|uniref:EamA domain-containing protein n=1 Tax=Aquatica leii TaxID=1421715 RepID=A0AAN7P829_9COLE|nr:hypothetical protein RN001_009582 [Aquatica leii]
MKNTSYYSILSGVSAAAASLFGKLCGLPILQNYLIVLRLIFFSLMIICNGSVWTFYVKALQSSESSLSATVLSSAINYLLSALFGYVIFGEVTSLIWWTGLSFVLLGVVLIAQDQSVANKVVKYKEHELNKNSID